MTEEEADKNPQQKKTTKRSKIENLGVRTPSEVQKDCRNGGIKSGEVRREKKTLKENFKLLLDMGIPKGSEAEKILKARGLSADSWGEALNLSTLLEALKGNAQMTKIAYDLADEGDTTTAEPLNVTVNIQSLKGGEEVDEIYKEKKGEDKE